MKWKAAHRSIDELDPAWYRSFDAGNPNHIMAAVEDLAVLDAHGFGVYLAPDQVGKLWMRVFYPATEAGERSCMWLHPLDKATLTAQFHAHCDRLAGMLQTWPDAARSLAAGPLDTPNVKPDTWARWRRHKPVCHGTGWYQGHEMHEDSLRTLIDVEYNDTLAQALVMRRQVVSPSMEAAFAAAMREVIQLAHRPPHIAAVWRAEALGRTRLAACVEWTPDRIETAEGVENAPRIYGARDWAKMKEKSLHALSGHCHALCDRERLDGNWWDHNALVGVWPADPYHRCPASAHVIEATLVKPPAFKAPWLASLGDGGGEVLQFTARRHALTHMCGRQLILRDHWCEGPRRTEEGNDNA